jgi:hypothetical protein
MIPPSEPGEPIEAELSFKPARFSCWNGGNSCPGAENIRMGRYPGRRTPFSLVEPFFWPKNSRNNVETVSRIVLRAPPLFFRSMQEEKLGFIVQRIFRSVPEEEKCERRFSLGSRAPNIVQGFTTMFREISGPFSVSGP